MTRSLTSFLLLVAILLGPALCRGGLLEHACECGEGIEATCEHEDECGADLCETLTIPTDREALDFLELELERGLLVVHHGGGPFLAPAPEDAHSAAPPPKPRDLPRLPYAPSERPLRL